MTAAGSIAYTTCWYLEEIEGQEIIAIPRLRVEHTPAMMISNGRGLGLLFEGSRLVTSEWEAPAGFVGGSWQLWKTGSPDLLLAGFVRGQPKFDIERAVRGVVQLLRKHGAVKMADK